MQLTLALQNDIRHRTGRIVALSACGAAPIQPTDCASFRNLPEAQGAVETLFEALGERDLPETLVSQYLARTYDDVSAARLKPTARNLAIASIRNALAPYSAACSRG
ncbi:class II D-tagatose-bisphosphate aldolase non-catalytic subunit [Pseudorhizobium pelagicum]|uniref:Uncharacterized protein n=1 Tax=Pseudorhizobium pelagicum TaxID=1509405 RepID=A0A922NW76_9HYPH|nr:class II D-tagatose-bisphosphate aldolase, non-catalytic subunit [Pseudorhizobium pelagicum]KEQ02829.1 hypothetical protein GV67_16895 [Pseudorhizobium pelagicum]KEQ02888.1 hypothetical protein GV68_19595 [Pseudorhizobium pelagicum]